MQTNPQYCIGSELLPGLAKMAEECGELLTVIGKLIATGGQWRYYDGRDLKQELTDEMADVMAALHFFVGANVGFDEDVVCDRASVKLAQFIKWHHAQLSTGIPGVHHGPRAEG